MATSRTGSSGLTRRQFLPVLGGAAVAAAAPRTLAAAPGGQPGKPPTAEARFVYVGTYTAPGVPPGGTHPSTALGIYVFRMDPHDGDLTPIQLVTTDNPSFLALDPTLTHLYSTNENVGGRFSAYAIDHAHGTLSFINTQPSQGDFPAHLGVHPSGAYLLGTNYGTGNYPIYRILADGSIGPLTDNFQGVGNGTGPNPAWDCRYTDRIPEPTDPNNPWWRSRGLDVTSAWNYYVSPTSSPGLPPKHFIANTDIGLCWSPNEGDTWRSFHPGCHAPNAPATFYWLWRFDRPDDPIPLDDLWGKTEPQAVADLQAARNPQVGYPDGPADVELAVDPYFPSTIPTVSADLRGRAVHFGGRNRLFLDSHVKYLRDVRTQ